MSMYVLCIHHPIYLNAAVRGVLFHLTLEDQGSTLSINCPPSFLFNVF